MTETPAHLPFPLHGVRPFRPEDREQLYAALGFLHEEVRLTKAVRPGPAEAAVR